MDESFDTVEDVDYCWRLQRETGVRLVYVPEAVVHMRYRTGWRDLFDQARSWGIGVVHVYVAHRPYGYPRPPSRRQWIVGFAAWSRSFARLRLVRNRGDFADWLFRFGYMVGWAEGSAQYRTLLLYPYHDLEGFGVRLVSRLVNRMMKSLVTLSDRIAGDSARRRTAFVQVARGIPNPRVRAYVQRHFSDPLTGLAISREAARSVPNDER
jgi:hypothetical protein